jgi:hypothetical protein
MLLSRYGLALQQMFPNFSEDLDVKIARLNLDK